MLFRSEASISRVMQQIVSPAHAKAALDFKKAFSIYQRNRDLISVGAYVPGADPVADAAIALYPELEAYLRQDWHDQATFTTSVTQLQALTQPR